MGENDRIELKPLPDGRWRAEFELLGLWAEDADPWEAAGKLKQQLQSLTDSRPN